LARVSTKGVGAADINHPQTGLKNAYLATSGIRNSALCAID
jgi:hypothetical protein